MAQCLAASGRYDPAGVRLRAAGRRFARIGAGAYLASGREPGRPAGHGPGRPARPACRADRRRAPGGAARPGGLSNEEIARQLSIQRGSVEFHLTSIYRSSG